MGTFGPIHWIILGAIVLLLFGGRGKLSSLMGDAAKGVKAFREGLKGEHDDKVDAAAPAAAAVQPIAAPTPEKDTLVR